MAVNPIKGKQLADAPNGVSTTKINDDAVTSAKVDGSVLSTDAANTPPGSDYSALTKKIIDLADPTADTDAVNLRTVQAKIAWKQNVTAATTGALPNSPTFASTPGGTATLTASAPAVLVIDDINITKIGQRVLVKNEANIPFPPPGIDKNGIYELTQGDGTGTVVWVLTRVADMNANAEVPGAATAALQGTANAGKIFAVTTPAVPSPAFVLNQSAMVWTQIGSTTINDGNGITVTGGNTVAVNINPTPNGSGGYGLTFGPGPGFQLRADIEANRGLKFDDVTGRFKTYLTSTPSVEGGLKYGANGGLAAKLEAPTVGGGGLSIGPNAGISVLFDPLSSGFKYTVTGIALNPKIAVAQGTTGGISVNNAGQVVLNTNPNAGIRINASNEAEVFLEASTPTDGGLEFGPNGGISTKRAATTPTVNSTGGIAVSAQGLLVNGDVLSTIASNNAPINDYSALGKQLKDLAPGVLGTDAVNVNQLNAVVQGLDWKDNVVTATDAALPAFTWSAPGGGTLTANANNALAIGGVPVTAGMRVLVKNEVGGNAPYNGIYTVTQPGDNLNPYILVRAVDANTSAKVTNGLATTVTDTTATTFGFIYVLTTPDPIVLNTTNLTFSAIPLPAGYTAGNGIDITGLVISALLGNSNPAIEFQGNTGLGLKVGNPANSAPGITRSANGAYNDVNNKKQWSDGVVSTGTGTAVTADTVALAPWRANGGDMVVSAAINGVEYEVANGGPPAAAVLFFSPDGVIIRTWQTIQVGDGLYRGGSLGFDTDATDRVEFTYLASQP